MGNARLLGACLAFCASASAGGAQSSGPGTPGSLTVTHYDVRIEPRLESRTVVGSETLTVALSGDADEIVLQRGALVIDSVEENGQERRRA